MPNETDTKGVRKLLHKANTKFEQARDFLLDSPKNNPNGDLKNNIKKSSSMTKPQSFSPAKQQATKVTSRKLDFGSDVATPEAPRKTRHNLLSFAMMLIALFSAVLLHGTCYIPFQPAHDAICPLVHHVKVTTSPVVDGMVTTISDATHALVDFEQDVLAKFEGQVARLQNTYPWMWRRKATGKGVLVSLLGVENTYAVSALDGLVVAGEIGLGTALALWVVSRTLKFDVKGAAAFFRR